MSNTVHIEGLEGTVAALRELGRKGATKLVKKGLRAGGRILAKAEKAEVPVLSGRLKKSITARTRKTTGQNRFAVTVGPRKAGKSEAAITVSGSHTHIEITRPKDPGLYGGWVALGHKTRNGKATQPNDFAQRAFDRAGEPAAKAATDVINEGIEQELK